MNGWWKCGMYTDSILVTGKEELNYEVWEKWMDLKNTILSEATQASVH